MDEATLLAALAIDLDGAFEALVRAQGDRVFSIALRLLGDRAEAEDVAQDAFVRAYRALGGWAPERIRELRLGAWLATITVNLVRNRTRRGAGATAAEPLAFTDELEHPTAVAAETPHDRLARREVAEAWAARLLALPERYRAPIVLRHVDGLGYGEIAVTLDRPEGTVKAQVHRGLALLRAAIAAEARPTADGGGSRADLRADLRAADLRAAAHRDPHPDAHPAADSPAPTLRPNEAAR